MSKVHLNQDHEEPIETGDPNLWEFTDSGTPSGGVGEKGREGELWLIYNINENREKTNKQTNTCSSPVNCLSIYG